MSSEPVRIIIADDHAFYRDGLAQLLKRSGLDVVAEAANGQAAIEAVQEHAPDVVVMDLNMPGMSGIEATRRLSELAPAARVLVLSVSAQEQDITDAVLAGAIGYVLKDGPVEEIVAGIRAAAAGQSLISPPIATLLLQRVRDEESARRDVVAAHLSRRELQVLQLMAEGRANPEIADELVISLSTVRNHTSSILLKLQVHNRVQAAVQAVRGRLV